MGLCGKPFRVLTCLDVSGAIILSPKPSEKSWCLPVIDALFSREDNHIRCLLHLCRKNTVYVSYPNELL